MTTNIHDRGPYGHAHVPGVPTETWLLRYYTHGAFVSKSTTGSSQATGAGGNGTFLYDITQGMVVVDGYPINIHAAADEACEAVGAIITDGQSIVYTVIAWLHPVTKAVTVKVVAGAAATSGAEVAATTDEIVAGLISGAVFAVIGQITIARTGDQTVTEAVNNTVRDLGCPRAVNE